MGALMVEIIELIQQGIVNDKLSFLVFVVLCSLFVIDIGLYICIWINMLFLNWQVNKGHIYQEPMKNILQGFEELLDLSTHQVNTRAYVEDFFSRYKATLIPIILKFPVISTIKFIKNTVSLFILVGVLGTFVGIYTSLVKVLNPNIGETEGITQVLTGLDSITPVLSGMGTAFATSIVGMSLALLTTFILKLFNAEQFLSGIMVRLVNYLDNEVRITKKSFVAKSFKRLDANIQIGFKNINENLKNIFNEIKGLTNFSDQFEEVSESVRELAVNSEDLQEISASFRNKKEVGNLIQSMDRLQESMDKFSNYQQNLSQQSVLIKDIYEEQRKIVEIYDPLQEEQEKLKELIEETLKQQQVITANYDQVLENINLVKEKFEDNIHYNTEEFKKTISHFRNSFSKEMNRNVSTFAEHVELSNQLINKGFDSIIDKFDNMDLVLGKYLNGVAFNASDLEDTIKELNGTVNSLGNNLRQHNQAISELKLILQENKNHLD